MMPIPRDFRGAALSFATKEILASASRHVPRPGSGQIHSAGVAGRVWWREQTTLHAILQHTTGVRFANCWESTDPRATSFGI